jgi:NADPH:quinone reductase-like Zn-dependent oxidoreductase
MAIPSPENLERLAKLLEDGVLRMHLQDSFPLDRAGEAMNALGATHTQGKLGVDVSAA